MNNEKLGRKVAILIPTYNGEQYIPELFESIERDTYPKDQLGIFVVDNASTDNTLAVIASRIKPSAVSAAWREEIQDCLSVTIIKNDKNFYFAQAINQAANAAIRSGHDYLFLLNQDTVLGSDCIQVMVDILRLDVSVAVVQARMMLYQVEPSSRVAAFNRDHEYHAKRVVGGGKQSTTSSSWLDQNPIVNSLGNAIHYLGFGFSVGNGKQWSTDCHSGNTPTWPITYASGGAMMVSAATWQEFGGFEECLEMYHEDLEFGWRLLLTGKRAVCARDAVVYHKYSFNPAPYKYYFLERNRFIVLLIHYHLWTLLLIAPMAIVMELGLICYSIKNDWWREKFRSYRDAIRMLPFVFELRKKSFALRKVGDREILKAMESTIKDQSVNNVLLDRIAHPVLKIHYRLLRLLI